MWALRASIPPFHCSKKSTYNLRVPETELVACSRPEAWCELSCVDPLLLRTVLVVPPPLVIRTEPNTEGMFGEGMSQVNSLMKNYMNVGCFFA